MAIPLKIGDEVTLLWDDCAYVFADGFADLSIYSMKLAKNAKVPPNMRGCIFRVVLKSQFAAQRAFRKALQRSGKTIDQVKLMTVMSRNADDSRGSQQVLAGTPPLLSPRRSVFGTPLFSDDEDDSGVPSAASVDDDAVLANLKVRCTISQIIISNSSFCFSIVKHWNAEQMKMRISDCKDNQLPMVKPSCYCMFQAANISQCYHVSEQIWSETARGFV